MSDDNDEVFPGFYDPRLYDGWTKMPHELIDEFPNINSVAELKVILYVMRHTWGFNEIEGMKKITIEEFSTGRKKKDGTKLDNGTGLGLTAVKDGVRKAVQHGYLTVYYDKSNPWRVKKRYGLKLRDETEEECNDECEDEDE
jgi:hypothetical protein